MTQKKEKAPVQSANRASAREKTLHTQDTTDAGEMQVLRDSLSCRIFDEVQQPLAYARTVLNDQLNDYFSRPLKDTKEDLCLLAYGYENASNRNEIAGTFVRSALEALEQIIAELEKKEGEPV